VNTTLSSNGRNINVVGNGSTRPATSPRDVRPINIDVTLPNISANAVRRPERER
jgi:hypothetical protein